MSTLAGRLGPDAPRRLALALLFLAGCSGKISESAVPDDPALASGGVGPSATTGGSGSTPNGSGGTTGGTGTAGGTGGSAGTSPGTGGTTGGGSSTGGTGADGTGQNACVSSASPGAPVPMRRLTTTQVERTVAELLAVDVKLHVSDERLLAYRSNISASVDAASARGYFDFAAAVVAKVDLSRCESDCRDWLFDEVGPGLFRRPLEATERERYSSLYELAAEDGEPEEAAGWVLEAMLQSPTFLYLDEVAKADGTLDDYSTAARLSLLLWGRNPDATLLEHAKDGALSSAAGVEAEVTRLLADPASEEGIREFVDQWLDLGRLDDADVRPDLADLGAATVGALRDEPVQYFRRLLEGGAGLAELLTSSRTVASPSLEALYDEDILEKSGDDVELDPERRAGILSLPGVVAALSHARRTSPTLRGKAVLTGLLCTPPEPPPANVNTTLPAVSDGVTTRDRLEEHMKGAACRGCHIPMDGLGFALEKLDWLGRFREEESGVTIDDSSTFPLGDEEVTVTGAVELGAMLSDSPSVAACVSKQWLRYSLGVTETHDADCLVEELGADVQGTNGLERLIVKSLTSDWFRRGPGEAP